MDKFFENYVKDLLLGYFLYSIYVLLCYTFIPMFTLFLVGKSYPTERLVESFSLVKAIIFIVIIGKIYIKNRKRKKEML
ncbi:hypothetical protein IGK25_002726 [Enterococcus sp. DIV1614a]